jgi:sugar/nucleoside kinase (ribokinase family)
LIVTRPNYDILLIGDYFFDQIYTGLSEFPELGREVCTSGLTTTGGAMYITAAALTRLGVNVGWAAYFGSDYYSQFVRNLALREGVDLSLAKNSNECYRLVTTSLPFQGERAFVTFADPEPPDVYDHWLESLNRCDFKHLHLGGMEKIAFTRSVMQRAKERGAMISLDCADGSHLDRPCDCRELVKMADIFMPNAREAMIVSEKKDLVSALKVLTQLVKLVVVKDGANGCWIGQGDEVFHVPGINPGEVIDTTGAGDCFSAGFLRGWVCENAPLATCGRYGNICGGLSVTGVGGATAAPTYEQMMRWV